MYGLTRCVWATAALLVLYGPAVLQAQTGRPPQHPQLPACPEVEEGRFIVALQKEEDVAEVRRRLHAVGDTTAVVYADSVGLDLVNKRAVRRLLSRHYPPALRDAGRGGESVLLIRVDENGAVSSTRVVHSAGEAELDEASMAVAEQLRFSPAVLGGCRIPVLMRLPVTFAVPRFQ